MAAPALLVALLAACSGDDTEFFEMCDLDLSLSVETAAPGDTVTLEGGPLSEPYDTVVTVAGIRAEVTEIVRDCGECDACRDESVCLPCGDCDEACLETCETTCVETLAFVVPLLDPATVEVAVLNTWGQSDGLALSIIAPPSTSLP